MNNVDNICQITVGKWQAVCFLLTRFFAVCQITPLLNFSWNINKFLSKCRLCDDCYLGFSYIGRFWIWLLGLLIFWFDFWNPISNSVKLLQIFVQNDKEILKSEFWANYGPNIWSGLCACMFSLFFFTHRCVVGFGICFLEMTPYQQICSAKLFVC